jgi:phosphoribosylglycinamide formyltransferase 1
MAKARVAILISGIGSNMAALIYAAKLPDCPFEVVLVASNVPEAPGLSIAAAEGIATFAHTHSGLNRINHDMIMDQAIRDAGADYVALAGYMRILTDEFVDRWAGRMLNIHPSLLPLYKGLDTHIRAIAAGDSHSGASVHLVTPTLDDGLVLGQIAVAIQRGETAESLAARVKMAEHQLYPRVLADYVSRSRDPIWLTGQVRIRAMQQPEADEVTSHGMACFGIIGGKKFAYISANHHGDGKVSLLVKISGIEEQAMLIEQDPDRYYRPAYFGDGWIAIRIDLGDTDWDHISEWLAKSWRAVAPKKLARMMDIADQF